MLVMDHGLIYRQKGFQRDALVFGVEHAKKKKKKKKNTVHNSMF